jgi:hypothetical protein
MKIILLNGPPRSGKSTCAQLLQAHFTPQRCAILGFTLHLKRMVHAIYGLAADTDPEAFDGIKDTSNPLFMGLSPRQAYILWTDTLKEKHGKEFFGRMFLRVAEQYGVDIVVVPDAGYTDEPAAVVERLGEENVLLARIDRHGTSFNGDTRTRLDLSSMGVAAVDVFNVPYDEYHMVRGVLTAIRKTFGEEYK